MKSFTPTHAQIAERAQTLWNAQDCPFGRDEVIWLQAEQQLRDENRFTDVPLKSRRRSAAAEEAPKSLEEEADPIANNALEQRLAQIGQPGSRGATAL